MIDKKTIMERTDRLRSVRESSVFPREFEAGMLYAYLTVLNEEPDLEDRSAVSDWVDKALGKDEDEEP
ncbi:MAG: hypothetical protein ACOC6H_01875 [Thermoproteota archaeon]